MSARTMGPTSPPHRNLSGSQGIREGPGPSLPRMKLTRPNLLRRSALAVTLAAITVATPTAPATAQTANSTVVLDWNVHTGSALAAAGRSTGISSPIYAIVQGAVYDAVNAIDGTHRPYLSAPPARRWYSQEAAAATAAYRTLAALLPEQEPMLRPLYTGSLATVPDGPAERGGISVGEEAAAAMLAARANDGRDGPSIVEIGTEPGEWRPTPPDYALDPASWLANVTPFLVPDLDRLRSPGPPPLTSTAYAKDLQEVKTYGALLSDQRTREQTDVATFWDQSPWNEIVRSLAGTRRLDTAASARLLAMTALSAADGAIACHRDKYHVNWWRPITAIREAGTDGNPATTPDDDWLPLLDTPPTPEHPSGHTCVSGAVTGALQTFFGTDTMTFRATSASSGTTRTFTRFSQALAETVDARVWSGIHFRTADGQGADIGKQVSAWMRAHYFQRRG
jgi:hypothetical protein